jgi:hypothetical protein
MSLSVVRPRETTAEALRCVVGELRENVASIRACRVGATSHPGSGAQCQPVDPASVWVNWSETNLRAMAGEVCGRFCAGDLQDSPEVRDRSTPSPPAVAKAARYVEANEIEENQQSCANRKISRGVSLACRAALLLHDDRGERCDGRPSSDRPSDQPESEGTEWELPLQSLRNKRPGDELVRAVARSGHRAAGCSRSVAARRC